LRGLPPAVVVIAGHDPLRDEGIAFGDALEAAEVATVQCRYDGGIHGFMTMPLLDLAQRARVEACRELSRLLAAAPGQRDAALSAPSSRRTLTT
jgi:acetyl esterase